MRRNVLVSLLLAISIVGLAGCEGSPLRPDNQAPVVGSLAVAINDQVFLGDVCPVICSATDPDGDRLTFEWKAGSGYVQGSGSEATYTPTSCCLGGNPVFVIVRDGRGGETRADLFIPVRP
jgi:hypothetical protein